MRNRRKLLVLLAAVMVAGGALLWFAIEREPSYEGRMLSEWSKIHGSDYASDPYNITSQSRKQEAADAIRQIGTNALPCLVAWMDYGPSRLSVMLETLPEKLPGWLRTSSPMRTWRVAHEMRSSDAVEAFEALETLATPAVPELIRRINETDSRAKAGRALVAMAYIGPETVPTLISILSSRDQEENGWSMDCIRIMGTNARPMVPVLVHRLQSSNAVAAGLSAATLAAFKLDSNIVVPALVKALKDPHFNVQFKAAETLGKFGELARPALPALSNNLNEPNPDVRAMASNTIWQITTAPGTNAPAQ